MSGGAIRGESRGVLWEPKMSNKASRSRGLRIFTDHSFTLLMLMMIGAMLLAQRWLTGGAESDTRPLTKPLRVEVVSAEGDREFLLGLRTHHYRAQLQSEAEYLDVYFDTSDGRLLKQGYSYRFRKETTSNADANYSVRLEREPRFDSPGAKKLDLVSVIPAELGEAISAGDWRRALLADSGLAAPARFDVLLAELRIHPSDVQPQWLGQLVRKRLDVTDKGRNWFELDHETWRFNRFDSPNGPVVSLIDLVVDTRLSEGDPELLRRVATMRELTKMIHGVRPTDHAPHERAAARMSTTDRD